MDLDGVISLASERLGFSIVRPNQHKSIKAFLEGNYVFVSLPTGSGKSLCYAVLPYAFDEFRGRDGSIAIIVSPLKASGIITRSRGRNSSNTNRCRSLH